MIRNQETSFRTADSFAQVLATC